MLAPALLRCFTLAGAALQVAAVPSSADAQQTPSETRATTNESPRDIDEIVVTRQRLSSMRKELEKAQEDLYKLFNANTSDHELDMHCHQEMPTGSRVSRRVCRPAFVDSATTQGAWDMMSYIYSQCGAPCPVADLPLEMGAGRAQQSLGKIPFMARRLDQEMQRLVRENPDVAKAFADYQSKERAYHEALSGQAKK
jgi:hypothetical protein